MTEVLIYDPSDVSDLIKCINVLFDNLLLIDDPYIVDDTCPGIRAVNLKQLICYEKHDRYYVLHFVDGTFEYDYRVGSKLFGNDTPKGFLQISRSTYINKAYLNHIFDDYVYLYNENKPRKISRHYKPAVYSYILSQSLENRRHILQESD